MFGLKRKFAVLTIAAVSLFGVATVLAQSSHVGPLSPVTAQASGYCNDVVCENANNGKGQASGDGDSYCYAMSGTPPCNDGFIFGSYYCPPQTESYNLSLYLNYGSTLGITPDEHVVVTTDVPEKSPTGSWITLSDTTGIDTTGDTAPVAYGTYSGVILDAVGSPYYEGGFYIDVLEADDSTPVSESYFIGGCAPSGTPTPSPTATPTPPPTQHAECLAYTIAGTSVTGVQSTADQLGSSPCDGDSWVFDWKNLETSNSPPTYNWKVVDAAISEAATTAGGHKMSALRVQAGCSSPSWMPAADMISVPNPTGGTCSMPIPWNADFQSQWDTFIKAFGARYDHNANVLQIEGGGDGPQGEARLTGSWNLWQTTTPPYSVNTFIGAIHVLIGDFHAAFPDKRVIFAGASGPQPRPQGVASPQAAFINEVTSWGGDPGVGLQWNGLIQQSSTATAYPNTMSDGFGYQFVNSVAQNSAVNFTQTLQYATSLGANWVECYESDLDAAGSAQSANNAAIVAFQSSGSFTA